MKKIILILSISFLIPLKSHAAAGLSIGLGFPYIGQYGIELTMGQQWTFHLGYNVLSLDTGDAEAKLTMPEALIQWHPFSGVFFLGLGAGQEKLNVKAEDSLTSSSAELDVTANTTIAKMGWMWGKMDEGFWFGMDVAYIMPSGGDVEITTVGFTPSDDEYQDVQEIGEQFAETAYVNITFARIGILF